MQNRQLIESDRKTQVVLAIIVFSAVQLQFVVRVVKGNYLNSALSAMQVATILIAATASLLSFFKGYSLASRLSPVTAGDEPANLQLPRLILGAFICAMAAEGVTIGLLTRR